MNRFLHQRWAWLYFMGVLFFVIGCNTSSQSTPVSKAENLQNISTATSVTTSPTLTPSPITPTETATMGPPTLVETATPTLINTSTDLPPTATETATEIPPIV